MSAVCGKEKDCQAGSPARGRTGYFALYDFCRAVSCHIRFWPDRRRVEEELMGHLLDRRDALEAAGVSRAEASEQAVAAMGDPAEIGTALNRYHNPLLGWLQIVVLWLVVLLGVAGLCLSLRTAWEERPVRTGGSASFAGTATPLEGDSLRVGDYTFALEKVRQYPGYGDTRDLSFCLNVSWLSPWLDEPEYWPESLQWADSSGAWQKIEGGFADYDPEQGWKVALQPDQYRHLCGWENERLGGFVLFSNRARQQFAIRELPAQASAVALTLNCGSQMVMLELTLEGGDGNG